jgi:hypothetical protein
MKDKLEKEIADFFKNQVDQVAVPPVPATLEGKDEPRFLRRELRKAARRSRPTRAGIAVTAVKIAGAAVVAAACVFIAPREASSPVAKGATSLFIDAELRASIFSAVKEVSFALGKSIVKE